MGKTLGYLLLALLAALVALAPGSGSSASAAEPTHVFDADLSLTGGCTTSALDTVPDPSCPDGPLPPSGSFVRPDAVATDPCGDIYVASYGSQFEGKEGRIDIFDPKGFFITEIKDEAPKDLAIDDSGHLYVSDVNIYVSTGSKVVRFDPEPGYDCATGKIAYEPGSKLVIEWSGTARAAPTHSIAIDSEKGPEDGYLFALEGENLFECKSAAEGNECFEPSAVKAENGNGLGLAVDSAHGLIYVNNASHNRIDVFKLRAPHTLVGTIDGAATPVEKFSPYLSLAVDEGSGNLFVYDEEGNEAVFEFTAGGTLVSTLKEKFQHVPTAKIAIDNGASSPNGAKDTQGDRYLYVPSHQTGVGHSFAFGPKAPGGPPIVESSSASGVSETEALLQATIAPNFLETTYTFEYATEESFKGEGFEAATVAASGTIPAGGAPVKVSTPATGLSPETTYHFRVVAENECEPGKAPCSDEASGEFTTYPAQVVESTPCENKALRTGSSALLPDCRAYELVTPPATNGRAPLAAGVGSLGTFFATSQASSGGGAVSFLIEGGALPQGEATGSLAGDRYLSVHGEGGWTTAYAGPSGAEVTSILPGSNSPDQAYSFWTAEERGSAVIEGDGTNYVRYPDGHSALIGRGSEGSDPRAEGKLISEGGGHIVFMSTAVSEEQEVALGENTTGGTFTLSFQGQTSAPIAFDATAGELQAKLSALPAIGPEGVNVSSAGAGGPYTVAFKGPLGGIDVPELGADASGLTVSAGEKKVTVKTIRQSQHRLEPQAPQEGRAVYDRTSNEVTHVVSLLPEDKTPASGENASYEGASLDGKAVAFKVGETLYFRYNDEKTYELGENVTFAGFAQAGSQAFYLEGGDLYRFDSPSEARIPFSASGDVVPVNVSPDGSTAFFVSPSRLGAENPHEDEATLGAENLYRSREGAISFIGTVTEEDVKGEETGIGLGHWAPHVVSYGEAAEEPSRTSAEGGVLLFESRAPLTGYGSEGHREVYRYDAGANTLRCLSCNPTGAAAAGEASLVSPRIFVEGPEPVSRFTSIPNLRADGERAFFQSSEPLVAADNDGLQDVYEWEEQGVGSCQRPGGCVFLISSGRSPRTEYLYAVSDSGNDVFFSSSDLLLPGDAEATPSIYDARVGGGFREPETAAECLGEACQPGAVPPPDPISGIEGAGNVHRSTMPHCPKGKRRSRRHGRVRCVPKHRRHHHRQTGQHRKGVGK